MLQLERRVVMVVMLFASPHSVALLTSVLAVYLLIMCTSHLLD
jgi:hypothetical protein